MRCASQVYANGPTHMADMVVVAVSDPEVDLWGTRGAWKQVTPEELTHSIIFHIEERINSGKITQEEP